MQFKGFRIYLHNLCQCHSRNSNPDLQKNSGALSLDSTTLPWPLNLERGRRVGGWTHHEGTYHLLRERGILYGLCRLLPNGPGAAHLLVSPVIYQGKESTFSSLLATENISHSKCFTKNNRLITRGNGLQNMTLSHSDLPVSTVTPSSQDTSRHKRHDGDRRSDSSFKGAYKFALSSSGTTPSRFTVRTIR